MQKIFFYLLSLSLIFISNSFADEEKILNIYNWSNYIDPATLDNFTKETGIKVNYATYDSDQSLESKLLSGNSGYDVVVPTASPFLARGIQNKLYQPLNKKLLTNYDNLDPLILAMLADPDPNNNYGIPWMWGTIGIGYNVNLAKAAYPAAEMTSLDIVFNPEKISKFKDCGVEMLDDKTDIFNTVFAYLKLNPNNKKISDFKKAESVLNSIKMDVKSFNTDSYIDDLASGTTCLMLGYSGDLIQAATKAQINNKNVEIKYFLPIEGSELWIDVLAIPKNAPHPENAHLFLNYMMRPEVIAENTNFVKYANGNKASRQFINKDILSNPMIYPSAEYLKKTFSSPVFNMEWDRMMTKAWTKIISKN